MVRCRSKRRKSGSEIIRAIRRKKINKRNRLERIISDYNYMEAMISIALVEQSKQHLSPEVCVDDIRKSMCKYSPYH